MIRKSLLFAWLLWAIGVTGNAAAAENASCPKGLICASNPATVVTALQEAGYKAKLTKPKDGPPYIETNMSGYAVDLSFASCEKNENCQSFSFRMSFVENPVYTASLMNDWNLNYRWLQLYRLENGGMGVNMDVSTVGGINQTNFADLCQIFDASLGDVDAFIAKAEEAAEAAKKTAAPAPASGSAATAAATP